MEVFCKMFFYNFFASLQFVLFVFNEAIVDGAHFNIAKLDMYVVHIMPFVAMLEAVFEIMIMQIVFNR